jgi:C-terminal processing protease CtpA/Prc
MRVAKFPLYLALAATLAGCGGGGGSGGGGPSPSPTPTSTGTGCTLRERQDWAFAQLNEWYLFPDLLASGANPASYPSVQDYIDALVAPARAQSRDRYFTYVTSIAEENAFFNSGSSAGFGIRLNYDSVGQRLFVMEAFEGAPALAAGIDRGTEILAIGPDPASLVTVASLFASGGATAVSNALGPSTAGVTRALQVRTNGATSTLSVTKADYAITPVSARYGVRIIDDGGRKVGYVNLRTFISTADPALRDAFASLLAQNVSEVIVDLRYNGGGLVSIAELMGDLLNSGRAGNVFSHTIFRASKTANNSTKLFANRSEAIAATKVAFIGTGSSASASELVINSQTPYLAANSALIGSNTYGKPVGQIGLDRVACDDRLRVVAFKTNNAANQGEYYTGLAGHVGASCAAGDDITRPLGDPQEASIKVALDFLAGRACTPIAAGAQSAQAAGGRRVLQSTRPSASQYELPGLF